MSFVWVYAHCFDTYLLLTSGLISRSKETLEVASGDYFLDDYSEKDFS